MDTDGEEAVDCGKLLQVVGASESSAGLGEFITEMDTTKVPHRHEKAVE